jgi:DNA-binding MarR family transcriptional regulator
MDLVLAIKRVRSRLRAESPSSGGWTISQLSTLARIIERGPVTASALAQSEHVRPQSIAELVAGLRAEGLVRTTPDPSDGRKVLLTATPEGVAVIEEVRASRAAWLARALDAVVAPEERADVARTVELLNRLAEWQPGTAAGDTQAWRG